MEFAVRLFSLTVRFPSSFPKSPDLASGLCFYSLIVANGEMTKNYLNANFSWRLLKK